MALLILGFLLLGAVELTVAIALAATTDWVFTFLALVLIGAVGAWVVKREGTATWRRVAAGVRAGQLPTSSVLDGCLVVVAGVLLLLPGFISDIAAIALTIPPIRAAVRTRVLDSMQRRIAAQVSTARTTAVFGFGTPGDFRMYGGPGAPVDRSGRGRYGDDVIDLDSEEVFADGPVAELEPPGDSPV